MKSDSSFIFLEILKREKYLKGLYNFLSSMKLLKLMDMANRVAIDSIDRNKFSD